MMIQELIDTFAFLKVSFDKLKESEDFNLSQNENKLLINFDEYNLELNIDDLESLRQGDYLEKKDFDYLDDCGFFLDDYVEIKVKCDFHCGKEVHKDMISLVGYEFDFNDKKISLGLLSPLFFLLTCAPNDSIIDIDDDTSIYQKIFDSIFTLKIRNINTNEIMDDIVNVLYWLNVHIFNKFNFSISIDFLSENYDIYMNVAYSECLFQEALRDKKIIFPSSSSSSDYTEIIPLKFYLKSRELSGDERFLCLYKILEFFTSRLKIDILNQHRFNELIKTEDILNNISFKGELPALTKLLHNVLGEERCRKLYEPILKRRIAKGMKKISLSEEIYSYRNSIVHAKEKEIKRAVVPDLFSPVKRVRLLDVIDEIAVACIEKYVTKYK